MSSIERKQGTVVSSTMNPYGVTFRLDIEGRLVDHHCYILHPMELVRRMGQEACGGLMRGCGIYVIQEDTDELNGATFECYLNEDEGKVVSFVTKPVPVVKPEGAFRRLWRVMKETW